MTRELVVERRDQLIRALRQMHDDKRKLELDIAATDGGVQDCDHWLSLFDADAKDE